MICFPHLLEYALTRAADWIADRRVALHARLYPVPEPVMVAPLAIVEAPALPPEPVIPVYDYCLYCGWTRMSCVTDHCPRCGVTQLETIPPEHRRQGAS